MCNSCRGRQFAPVPQKQQGEFRKLVVVGASPTRGSSLRRLRCGWRRLPTVASAKVGVVIELPGHGWQAIQDCGVTAASLPVKETVRVQIPAS